MLKAMFGNTEITIKHLTINLDRHCVENALLDYVGRRAVKNIINAVMDELSKNNNQIIAEIENKLYKLVLNDNNVPVFYNYNLKAQIANILISKGFSAKDAYECVDSIFLSPEPDSVK